MLYPFCFALSYCGGVAVAVVAVVVAAFAKAATAPDASAASDASCIYRFFMFLLEYFAVVVLLLQDSQWLCVICMGELETGSCVRRLPCEHVFHCYLAVFEYLNRAVSKPGKCLRHWTNMLGWRPIVLTHRVHVDRSKDLCLCTSRSVVHR